jgi:hypothetical protein
MSGVRVKQLGFAERDEIEKEMKRKKKPHSFSFCAFSERGAPKEPCADKMRLLLLLLQ